MAVVAVIMVVNLDTATGAWATFKATRAATNAAAAHGMVTPAQPTCSGLGVLSLTLNWAAPSDAAVADVYGSGNLVAGYEVGKSSSSGGPYTYADNGTSRSSTMSVSSGESYFVVRSYKYSWRSTASTERHVHGVLGLLASCP
jgi:hypothetical protein